MSLQRHIRPILLLLIVLSLAASANVSFCCAEDELTLIEAYFAGQESVSGWVEVPGRGQVRYYAQNDTLWGDLIYESKDSGAYRPFRDSGCSPTAVAMAIRQLVPEDQLSVIVQYEKRPFSLCPCSINKARCTHGHPRYILTSDRDFDRFLPLVFADFAAGNNIYSVVSRGAAVGTSAGYVRYLADIYGLTLTTTSSFDEARAALESGASVVAHASRGAAFTNTGHYVYLAGVDDENAYILDPLSRDTYKTKNASKLNILQPGLVSIKLEDLGYAGIGSYTIFSVQEKEIAEP